MLRSSWEKDVCLRIECVDFIQSQLTVHHYDSVDTDDVWSSDCNIAAAMNFSIGSEVYVFFVFSFQVR